MPVEPTDGQKPGDVEPTRPARRKRIPSIERPSTSSSDGRPFWALWAPIIPTQEGVELGQQILPAAEDLIRRSRELPKVGWDDWLKDYLIESADQLLRMRCWMIMPSSETYRQHYRSIEAAATHLLAEIQKPPLPVVQPFDSQLLALTGLYLRDDGPRPNNNHLLFDNFERMLIHVISACRECLKVEGAAGARGRPDLLYAAAASADLWTELSGCRFPKSVAVIENVGGANPGFPEFKSPGPRFVAELLRAFDPQATFAEVRTALKGLPVEPRVQE